MDKVKLWRMQQQNPAELQLRVERHFVPPGVEKVNFFLGPQTGNENIFCQNPKVPPTLRARETSFTPRIPRYHLKKLKALFY